MYCKTAESNHTALWMDSVGKRHFTSWLTNKSWKNGFCYIPKFWWSTNQRVNFLLIFYYNCQKWGTFWIVKNYFHHFNFENNRFKPTFTEEYIKTLSLEIFTKYSSCWLAKQKKIMTGNRIQDGKIEIAFHCSLKLLQT